MFYYGYICNICSVMGKHVIKLYYGYTCNTSCIIGTHNTHAILWVHMYDMFYYGYTCNKVISWVHM